MKGISNSSSDAVAIHKVE